MKLKLGVFCLVFCFAAFAEDAGESRHTGAHKLDTVEGIDWMQADQVAVPSMEFDNARKAGKAGLSPDAFSYRKENPGAAAASIVDPGKGKGAPEGDTPAGLEPIDMNKLSWRASSTALVDGKAQLVQFGYDDSGRIRGVKFADNDATVRTDLDPTFPQRLRSVSGNISQTIGGRQVTSLKNESQRCAG